MCRPILVCVFFIYFRQTFAKKRDFGKGGVFLRTETINSIGDTYIRMVLLGWANPGVHNSNNSSDIDCCIEEGKLLGERWFVAGNRWKGEGSITLQYFFATSHSYCSFDRCCWETLSSGGCSFWQTLNKLMSDCLFTHAVHS